MSCSGAFRGNAKRLSAATGSPWRRRGRCSGTSGSPQYMAPEQADPARAARVDYRSDVFSAAVVLYETLSGRVPFGVESPADLARLEQEGTPIETRSEEHTSELQSRPHLVCRLLLE